MMTKAVSHHVLRARSDDINPYYERTDWCDT